MALAYFETASWATAGTTDGTGARYKDVSVTGLAAGDMLVAHGVGANDHDSGTQAIATQAGSTTAWTTQAAGTTFDNDVAVVAGWARVTSGTTATIRVAVRIGSADLMGASVVVIPAAEHNGSGSPTFTTFAADADGQVSVTLAGTSTVVYGAGDWNAANPGTTNTPAGSTNRTTYFDGVAYAAVTRTWTAQAGGSRNYGPSGLSGLDYSGVVVVVPESGSAGPSPISLRAAGTATGATTAVTVVNPAVPSGATTGDLSVLTVWMKPYGTTITTPSGWLKIGEHTNGTTVAGTDTGSTKVAVFVRESASVGAIGNLSLAGSPDSVGAVINTYAKDSSMVWDVAQFTTGSDATNGANYSATGAAGIAVTTGDWVLQSTAVNGDVGTQSAQAVGGMSGATLGTYAARQSADVTTGTDSHGEVGDVEITAGSSSSAPTFTYTNASSGSGSTIWLRLRQAVPRPRNIRAGNAALQRSFTR